MTQAEKIILSTRKKRKRQMIFKGLSAIYMVLITTLLVYILVQMDFSLPAHIGNIINPTPEITLTTDVTPTPEVTPIPEVTPTPEDSEPSVPTDTPSIDADTETKYIALTYDDGPSTYTSYLLDTLETHNAQATFFIIGNRLDRYRDTIKRMDYLDMEIASHTYGHDLLTKLEVEEIEASMNQTDEILSSIIGHGATLMRPVGGAINDELKTLIHKPIILWDIDTLDWKTKDTEAIVNHVLENIKDGSVVLMHDIYPTTIEASQILIPTLQEMGYKLVTVSELAKIKEIELLPSEIYSSFPTKVQQITQPINAL